MSFLSVDLLLIAFPFRSATNFAEPEVSRERLFGSLLRHTEAELKYLRVQCSQEKQNLAFKTVFKSYILAY